MYSHVIEIRSIVSFDVFHDTSEANFLNNIMVYQRLSPTSILPINWDEYKDLNSLRDLSGEAYNLIGFWKVLVKIDGLGSVNSTGCKWELTYVPCPLILLNL